ncbi:MAG TPA: CoA pyrophosphatase, partial [Dongiaceae bacterium]
EREPIEAIMTAIDLPQRLAAAINDSARLFPTAGGKPVESECALGPAGSAAPRREALRMSPELSYGRHAGPPPATARRAAVMLLLFQRGGRWHIPLTQRPAALVRHGGQISLPGGHIEPGESSDRAARRELGEELGIVDEFEVLGRLPNCYVYASDYVVTPHVACSAVMPRWRPDDREVERVVELPLEVLLRPQSVERMTIRRGPLEFRAPCYVFRDDRIWGATSVILAELADVLRQLEWGLGRSSPPIAKT